MLVVPMLGIDGDADVHREIHLEALHRERLPRQFGDAPRRPGGLLRTGKAGHQQAKLGVAEPGKRVRSAQTLLDPPDQEADQLVGERLTQRIGDQLEQSEVDDEHGDRLLRAVRGQDRLVDAIVEQDAVAQSGGIVAQRRQLVVGQQLRDIVENGGAHPLAAPLEAAQRCVQLDALAIAAPPDQRAQRPVAAAEQAWLIMLGHVEQPAERGAHELAGGVAEHLAERAIARPDAAVAIEGQDRSGALFREGRHERRRIGTARHSGWPAVRSGCETGQRADHQREQDRGEQGPRRQHHDAGVAGQRTFREGPGPRRPRTAVRPSARTSGETAARAPGKGPPRPERARGSPAAVSRLRADGWRVADGS